MAMQDVVERFLEKNRAKKERFETMEDDSRFSERREEKKMSANERELGFFRHRQREDGVKRELDRFRKREGSMLNDNRRLFKQKDITKNGNTILKQRNIFLQQKNMFLR